MLVLETMETLWKEILALDSNIHDETKVIKAKMGIVRIQAFLRSKAKNIESSLSTTKVNQITNEIIDLSSKCEESKPKSNRYTLENESFSCLYVNRFDILKDIELHHEVNDLKNKSYDNENDIAFSRSGNSFTYKTLETLSPKQCISSQIIEVMAEMFYDRHVAKTNNKPSIVYFHNYFFKEIMKDGVYVFKLSKFKHLTTLDTLDALYIPVHSGCHFFLMTYNFKTKTIKYFDSLFNEGRGKEYSQYLLNYVLDLYDFYKMKVSKDNIVIDISMGEIPQQQNSFDCGIYTLMYMDFLIDNISFEYFKSTHLGSYRETIMLHLYKDKLTY
jgi:Ulp1 family protease